MTDDQSSDLIFDEKDFRYERYLLAPEAFALPGGDYTETNRLDKATWRTIISLPDDVSIRTSGNFGDHLKAMNTLSTEWIPPIPNEVINSTPGEVTYVAPNESPIDYLILDTYEQFEACTFNALTGYYWIAVACLRGAIELSVIGAYFEIEIRNGNLTKADFDNWYDGGAEQKFGNVCDLLQKTPEFSVFQDRLRKELSSKLAILDQRTREHNGGWARSLYSTLSDTAHTRPHVAARYYWDGSNGPVFVTKSFLEAYRNFLEVMALCRVVLTVAKPTLHCPLGFERLLTAPGFNPSEIAQTAFRVLWNI